MKNLYIMLLLVPVVISSCRKEEKLEYDLNVREAETLVHDWINATDHYSMDSGPVEFSLTELTTDILFLRTEGQLFHIESPAPGLSDKWIFIKNELIYDLHPGSMYANGTDFKNIQVADLDGNSIYEIIYTAHAGSGVLYQTVNIFYLAEDEYSHLESTTICTFPLDYEITLISDGLSRIFLYYTDRKYHMKIGEITTNTEDGASEYSISLYSDIPESILDKLNGSLKRI